MSKKDKSKNKRKIRKMSISFKLLLPTCFMVILIAIMTGVSAYMQQFIDTGRC